MKGVCLHYENLEGDSTDITDAVQALYDLAINSMDFRSGFWSYEDAAPVAKLAEICGFEQKDDIQKYLTEQRHHDETTAFRQAYKESHRELFPAPNLSSIISGISYEHWPEEHKHVYSAAGRCMWPGCHEVAE